MTESTCIYCGKKIEFKYSGFGKALPFDPGGGERHYCEEYIRSRRDGRKKSDSGLFNSVDFSDLTMTESMKAKISRIVQSNSQPVHETRLRQRSVNKRENQLNSTSDETIDDGVATPRPRRSPPWHRDEILLATELYLRHGGRMPGPDHPDVIELSKLLICLPLHPKSTRPAKFRNPSGVAMKLSNIRAVDPRAIAAGHAHGSRQDGVFWTDLKGDRTLLEGELQRIRRTFPPCFADFNSPINFLTDTSSTTTAMHGRYASQASNEVREWSPDRAADPEQLRWIAAIAELQSTPWFSQIETSDPRFRWFMRNFQGYASPSAKHLTDILRRIASTPFIARNETSRIPELVTRLRDYCNFLYDLKLEDELFTVLSGIVDAKMVPHIAAELEWDGKVVQVAPRRSRYTTNAVKEIASHTYWTPALNRALRILLKERIEEVGDVTKTLLAHEVIESPDFSLEGLREACRAFRRTMPHALRTK